MEMQDNKWSYGDIRRARNALVACMDTARWVATATRGNVAIQRLRLAASGLTLISLHRARVTLFGLVAAALLLIPTGLARAIGAEAYNGTGAGSGYCSSVGGSQAGASFLNIYACNGHDSANAPVYNFQCVELAERFFHAAMGFWVWGANTGAQFVYAGSHEPANNNSGPNVHNLPVGTPGVRSLPSPGDIISYTGTPGHVAVVTAVSVSVSNGTGTITVMEQNWSGSNGYDTGDNGGYNTIQVNGWNWSESYWTSNSNFSWLSLGLTSAQAPPPPSLPPSFPKSWVSVHNFNSGKCVDASSQGTANGTRIQQYDCNGNNGQQYLFVPVGGGYFEVENRNLSSQVWDVINRSATIQTPIQLWSWQGGYNQQWAPVAERNNGWYHFVSRNSGLCLDVPGASTANSVQLQQYTCNGTAAQSFLLFPATYVSVVNRNSGKCVDVRGGGTANGTAIQQYDCNGTNAQKFWFASNGGSWFAVANLNAPSQVWDVTGVSAADGAPIQLYSWVGGNNQQWTPVAEGNGYYHFVSRNSGKCLDVPGASTASGVQLQQYGCNGSAAQSFLLA
jgi:Ricin-type beta-trefoil lectin domain-like